MIGFDRIKINFLFLFAGITWHFAAVSYSLYKRIYDESDRQTETPIPTAHPQSIAETVLTTTTAHATAPPSYDEVCKIEC